MNEFLSPGLEANNIHPPEKVEVRDCLVTNFSGRDLSSEILPHIQNLLDVASQIVALPDFGPGRSPLPTGSVVEIDTTQHPDWRRYAVGDVGCGMEIVQTDIPYTEFMQHLALWDEVARRLELNKNKEGDLGGGNHFLDAVVTAEQGNISFVVHTGSRNESGIVDPFVSNPEQFDAKYKDASDWAAQNRNTVLKVVEDVYKRGLSAQFQPPLLDTPHNSYEIQDNKVIIFKGANHVEPGKQTLIPSHMNGPMVLATVTEAVSQTLGGISHGTGRVVSISDFRKLEVTDISFRTTQKPTTDEEVQAMWNNLQLYVPEGISIGAEHPEAYRSLPDALAPLNELLEPVMTYYYPVAYLGHI